MKAWIRENRWWALSWVGALVLVGVIATWSHLRMSLSFMGVTQGLTFEVKQAFAVKVDKLLVTAGQRVEVGTPLVEFDPGEWDLRIKNLRIQLAEAVAQSELNSHLLKQTLQLNSSQRSRVDSEVLRLSQELRALEDQRRHLLVLAPFSGVIEQVAVNPGETLQAHAPVLALSHLVPSRVQGFLDESVRWTPSTSEPVEVVSLVDPMRRVRGTVESLGVRMVLVPDRLKPFQELNLWGREVQVSLPEMNPFFVGEKVKITLESRENLLGRAAFANEKGHSRANPR